MGIRRKVITTTEELYDDNYKGTELNLDLSDKAEVSDNTFIAKDETPRKIGIHSDENYASSNALPKAYGRTYADLFSEQKDDPRVVVIVLYVIAFLIFIMKIDIKDIIHALLAPFILGTCFNGLWFAVIPGFKLLASFFKGKRD